MALSLRTSPDSTSAPDLAVDRVTRFAGVVVLILNFLKQRLQTERKIVVVIPPKVLVEHNLLAVASSSR